MKYDYVIGIDPGVNSGFALWDCKAKKLVSLRTNKIHYAMNSVTVLCNKSSSNVLVRVEDARKRKWFGKNSDAKMQGAGSVKRDCTIWEDFLTDLGVDFEMVDPKNNKTKWSADVFKKVTKYDGRTSQHSRDAAGLCLGW
jgi:hypothetical protein